MKKPCFSYKSIRIISLSIFSIIVLSLPSCSSGISLETATNSQAPTFSPTFVPLSNTPTQTPTQKPIITPTLTPLPTLQAWQVEATIYQWLQKPDESGRLGFLGIIPDQTGHGEALNIFNQMGIRIPGDVSGDGISFVSKNGYHIYGYKNVKQAIVHFIKLDISIDDNRPFALKDWFAFSPQSLIERYGAPSKVDIWADFGFSYRQDYELDMFFEQQNLNISYNGIYVFEGKSVRICPLTDNLQDIGPNIRIWMGKDPDHPPVFGSDSLEKKALMSVADFSAMLTGDPSKACFIYNLDDFR